MAQAVRRIGGKIRPTTCAVLRLSCKSLLFKRVDERTRTADLLITSEKRALQGLQAFANPAYLKVLASLACCALRRIALPVVSEWCQLIAVNLEIHRSRVWERMLLVLPLAFCPAGHKPICRD